MPAQRHVAIVGAGQAAARTAAALRAAGYDGSLTLFGDELELPYERPPLSKEALFGSDAPAPAVVYGADFYREQGVNLLLGETVKSLDAGTRTLSLVGGSSIRADRIVLATGSRARQMTQLGIDPERVVSLRSLADARRLRALLSPGRCLLLIGGGFIGLEIAAGATRLGCAVTVIEAKPRLLERAVSATVSAAVHTLHLSRGVDIRLGRTVVSARQGTDEVELLLDDGSHCSGNAIVMGVGAEPNDELARAAGLACSNGIEVDVDCATSAEYVWAIGDVAARHHAAWGRRVRIESWDNAENHAARAAISIAASWHPHEGGGQAPFQSGVEAPPWFWTDQYELNLQILGNVTESNQVITRPGPEGCPSIVFHFRDSTLQGAELLSAARDKPLVRRLLQAGWHLPPEKLADTDVSLKSLASMSAENGRTPN